MLFIDFSLYYRSVSKWQVGNVGIWNDSDKLKSIAKFCFYVILILESDSMSKNKIIVLKNIKDNLLIRSIIPNSTAITFLIVVAVVIYLGI